jgi:hypothetical protein
MKLIQQESQGASTTDAHEWAFPGCGGMLICMAAPTAEVTQAGYCGVICRACRLYIGSTEERATLAELAVRSGKSLEEVTCLGCRSDVVSGYCRNCHLRTCAENKGVAFCADCAKFPCADLLTMAAKNVLDPTRALRDAEAIRAEGWQAWCAAKLAEYACPSCGVINSAFDLVCRKCDHDPSSAFVGQHKEAIARLLAGR